MTKVSADTAEVGLIRGIRRWDLVAIAINGIIGAGIFGLPSKIFSLIGSYSLIAFVVCAFVVTLFIFCFADFSSRFDETGGPYLDPTSPIHASSRSGQVICWDRGRPARM